MSSVRSTKSKGKKAPSRQPSAAKIVEQEDVNNNTQEKIVEDPIPEAKPEVNEEEETSDHQEEDQPDDDTAAEEAKPKKRGRPPKKQKSIYSSQGVALAESEAAKQSRLSKATKLAAMTEEEKAEYLAQKAEKKREAAERTLAQRAKFTALALEQRQKVARFTPEEKAEYYKKIAESRRLNKQHKQAGLVFPVDKTAKKLRSRFPSHKFTRETAVFTAAVLEYMTAELLELAGNVAADYKKKTIKPRHIMLAARSDDEIDRVVGRNCLFEKAGRFPFGVQKCLMKNHQSRREGEWEVDMALRKIELKEEN